VNKESIEHHDPKEGWKVLKGFEIESNENE
jgi:hypothetical protein